MTKSMRKLVLGDLIRVADVPARCFIIVDYIKVNFGDDLKMSSLSNDTSKDKVWPYDCIPDDIKKYIDGNEVDICVIGTEERPAIYVSVTNVRSTVHDIILPFMVENSVTNISTNYHDNANIDYWKLIFNNLAGCTISTIVGTEHPNSVDVNHDAEFIMNNRCVVSIKPSIVYHDSTDANSSKRYRVGIFSILTEMHTDIPLSTKRECVNMYDIYRVLDLRGKIMFRESYRDSVHRESLDVLSDSNKLAIIGITNEGMPYIAAYDDYKTKPRSNLILVKDMLKSISEYGKLSQCLMADPDKISVIIKCARRYKGSPSTEQVIELKLKEVCEIDNSILINSIYHSNVYKMAVYKHFGSWHNIVIESEEVINDMPYTVNETVPEKNAIMQMVKDIDDAINNYVDVGDGMPSYVRTEKYIIIRTMGKCDADVYYVDSVTGQTTFYPQGISDNTVFMVIPVQHPEILYTAVLLKNDEHHNIIITDMATMK